MDNNVATATDSQTKTKIFQLRFNVIESDYYASPHKL